MSSSLSSRLSALRALRFQAIASTAPSRRSRTFVALIPVPGYGLRFRKACKVKRMLILAVESSSRNFARKSYDPRILIATVWSLYFSYHCHAFHHALHVSNELPSWLVKIISWVIASTAIWKSCGSQHFCQWRYNVSAMVVHTGYQ